MARGQPLFFPFGSADGLTGYRATLASHIRRSGNMDKSRLEEKGIGLS